MAYQARVLYDFQVNAVIAKYSMLWIAENFQNPFKLSTIFRRFHLGSLVLVKVIRFIALVKLSPLKTIGI